MEIEQIEVEEQKEIISYYEQALNKLKEACKIDVRNAKKLEELETIETSLKSIDTLLKENNIINDYEKAMELLKEMKKQKTKQEKILSEIMEQEDTLQTLRTEIIEIVKNI